MPTYPIINKETGEQKEIVMSISEWDKFTKDNPEWIRDWSDPSTCPGSGEVGEWKDRLVNKNPGWGEVLKKAHKSAGSKSQMQI